MKRIIGFPYSSPLTVDSLMPMGIKRSTDINRIDCKVFYTRSKLEAKNSSVEIVFLFLSLEELETIEGVEIIDDLNLSSKLLEHVMLNPIKPKKVEKAPEPVKNDDQEDEDFNIDLFG